jgi:GT2 family glycosyltransferase
MGVLASCLDSLRRQTFQDFRIIMVDNGSSDGSVELVNQSYPEVQVVRLGTNLGFARAVNEGIKRARSDYVALLNNDTVVETDWLSELVGFMERDPEVGFCASKVVSYHDPRIVDSCGDAYMRGGKAVRIGAGKPDSPFFQQPREVFGASAAASIYRQSALNETGLFDEDYFCYYEDVDLSCRMRLLGYSCFFVPSAVVQHIRGHTGGKVSNYTAFYGVRNCLWTVVKNVPDAPLRENWHRVLAALIRMTIYYIVHGAGTAALRGLRSGVREIPATLHKREQIQRNRRLSDDEWRRLVEASETLLKRITDPVVIS